MKIAEKCRCVSPVVDSDLDQCVYCGRYINLPDELPEWTEDPESAARRMYEKAKDENPMQLVRSVFGWGERKVYKVCDPVKYQELLRRCKANDDIRFGRGDGELDAA